MGIPFYFKAITQKHTHLIARSCGNKSVHGLYLDLNCAIHQCARDALDAIDPFASKDILERDIIQRTVTYMHKIIDFVNPKDTLFVSIDGPPPRAKMVQQRKRRFISSWREEVTMQTTKPWDRNAITPGTEFMAALGEALRTDLDAFKLRSSMNVIFYDSNEPGEGEAKIFQHIGQHTGQHTVQHTGQHTGQHPADTSTSASTSASAADVVYGLDADLIMLSLIACAKGASRSIYLLRETAEVLRNNEPQKHTRQDFMYFDTFSLANIIAKTGIDVRDYVVLCFLLGNDFVPPLSYLKINNNGIDVLIQHYQAVLNRFDKTQRLVMGEEINFTFLLAIIERLKDEEDVCLALADKAYYAFTPHHVPSIQAASMDPKASQLRMDNYPSIHKFSDVIRPNTTGWRPRYYYHLFYKMTDAKDIDAVCANYLEGIQWTFDYYFRQSRPTTSLAWGWYYRFEYSPTSLDMYNYVVQSIVQDGTQSGLAQRLRDAVQDVQRYDVYDPLTIDRNELVLVQLMMVLPPASFHLLPRSLRSGCSDPAYGLVHMYPTSFALTTYLKKFMWECHPTLPLVDMMLIQAFVKKYMCS